MFYMCSIYVLWFVDACLGEETHRKLCQLVRYLVIRCEYCIQHSMLFIIIYVYVYIYMYIDALVLLWWQLCTIIL